MDKIPFSPIAVWVWNVASPRRLEPLFGWMMFDPKGTCSIWRARKGAGLTHKKGVLWDFVSSVDMYSALRSPFPFWKD